MLSDRQIAGRLAMSYDTLLRWRKEKPLLYQHIKEGFELKELIIEMDGHMRAISRRTRFIRLKESVAQRDEPLYEVFRPAYDYPMRRFLADKPYVWLESDAGESLGILTYRDDVTVDDTEDPEARIFIRLSDFQVYGAEDGSDWLVHSGMKLSDVSRFYEGYAERRSPTIRSL